MFEARRESARAVARGDRSEAEHAELVEEELDVRRDVVGDENQWSVRRLGNGLHTLVTDELRFRR